IASNTFVVDAAILATAALPVLFGPEDALAEQAILLRPAAAMVDRFGLLDLPERPQANIVRARQADPHRVVVVDTVAVDRQAGVLVDSFRLDPFAVRRAEDGLGAGEADPHRLHLAGEHVGCLFRPHGTSL